MKRRSVIIRYILPASLMALTIPSMVRWYQRNTSPEAAMQRFYRGDGVEAEVQIMDPLIVAGEKVVPLVLRDIPNKEMPQRRYAIGFLGNGGYRQALPHLERILVDTTEIDYFRMDALESIYRIDAVLADIAMPASTKTAGMRWVRPPGALFRETPS